LLQNPNNIYCHSYDGSCKTQMIFAAIAMAAICLGCNMRLIHHLFFFF
jgi:hypothetical protein